MCDLSAENNQGETPLKLRKNKSLPKWISSLSQVGRVVRWPLYVTCSLYEDVGHYFQCLSSPSVFPAVHIKWRRSSKKDEI